MKFVEPFLNIFNVSKGAMLYSLYKNLMYLLKCIVYIVSDCCDWCSKFILYHTSSCFDSCVVLTGQRGKVQQYIYSSTCVSCIWTFRILSGT